jgi:hypothetical protein
METAPRVEARPPALIESAVGLIIPPAAREHAVRRRMPVIEQLEEQR